MKKQLLSVAIFASLLVVSAQARDNQDGAQQGQQEEIQQQENPAPQQPSFLVRAKNKVVNGGHAAKVYAGNGYQYVRNFDFKNASKKEKIGAGAVLTGAAAVVGYTIYKLYNWATQDKEEEIAI